MTNAAFSKAMVDVLELAILNATILASSACITVQGQNSQLNYSLEERS